VWAVNATTHQLLRVDPSTFTGVQEQVVRPARIYPNPAQDQIRLEGLELAAGTVLEVVDMAGRVVARRVAPTAGNPVDVSALQPGSYLLRVTGMTQHLRFVIQR